MRLLVAVAIAVSAVGCSHHPTGPDTAPDSVANYRVTFHATWSGTTHPLDFPGFAHFSGLIGATHSDHVVFWRAGQLASPGIQAMAELGSKTPLNAEIAAAISAGTARFELSGGGVSPSPGSVSLDFSITDDHPLVSLVSMIAPSPDWFVGVADLALLQNGAWVDSVTVPLYGWDAGTDVGATYVAPNAPASPHVPVVALEDPPFEVGGTIPPLGTFTFVRRP